MAPDRTLFKAGTVVTMDSTVPNLATGAVLVDGDRIAAFGANIQADGAEVIDVAGSIVMPGLIDAHHHGQQRSAMRYRRFRGGADVPAPISVEAMLEAATKRAGKLVGVDVAKLTADVTASREYLLEASRYRSDRFVTSTAAAKTAA